MFMGLSLAITRLQGGTSILALLSGSNGGVWPLNDASTLWQVHDGTGAVTDTDPVGRVENALNALPHLLQSTAADRPAWSEADNALDFDGVTEHLTIDNTTTPIGANGTIMLPVKSTDTDSCLVSESGQSTPITLSAKDGSTSVAVQSGEELWVDGVRMYSPTEDELHEAGFDGSWHIAEARSVDMQAANYADIDIGQRGDGARFYDGLLGSPVLTDETDASVLTQVANKLASEYGATWRGNDTAEDVVQAETDTCGLWDTTVNNYLWQDDTGQTETTADQDPVGLILSRGNGLSVDSDRVMTGLGGEEVTNGGFDADSDWTKGTGWEISGGAARRTGSGGNLDQASVFEVGKTYLVSVEITESGGSFLPRDSGNNNIFSGSISSVDTHTAIFTAQATGFRVYSGSSSGAIDNVSVKEIPGPAWYQDTSGERPLWDETEGLLDFDGVSHHLIADLPTRSADMLAMFVLNTSDTDFSLLASSDGTAYIGYAKDADATATLDANAGTPTYWVNTALQSWADRDAAHTALSTGGLILFECVFDGSAAAWATVNMGKFGSVHFDGLAMPLYLGPNPGVIGRNIIRARAKTMFPSLSF